MVGTEEGVDRADIRNILDGRQFARHDRRERLLDGETIALRGRLAAGEAHLQLFAEQIEHLDGRRVALLGRVRRRLNRDEHGHHGFQRLVDLEFRDVLFVGQALAVLQQSQVDEVPAPGEPELGDEL